MKSDEKAGLYITIIFHLVVIIVLLVCQISSALKRENTFVLDFSKQEKVEKETAERNLKEEVSERLDRMLAEAAGVPIRNVAVDRGALKDDRNTNAEELYKDAEQLAKKILLEKQVGVLAELSDGSASAEAWGCDLTYEYVRINGDYRS